MLANGHISGPLFGVLLGACVMAVGVLLYVRVRRPGPVPSPLAMLPRVRVLVIGVPQLVGVVIGWRLAHALPTNRLRLALAGVLIVVGPYLILRNA